MKKTNYNHDLSIQCGKVTDSFDTLKRLCAEEAEKLLSTLDISSSETITIPFWTADFPELICVGYFKRDKTGSIVYELNFSESTL